VKSPATASVKFSCSSSVSLQAINHQPQTID
jgi:hypothetical protein